jgi:hypothetical protein
MKNIKNIVTITIVLVKKCGIQQMKKDLFVCEKEKKLTM